MDSRGKLYFSEKILNWTQCVKMGLNTKSFPEKINIKTIMYRSVPLMILALLQSENATLEKSVKLKKLKKLIKLDKLTLRFHYFHKNVKKLYLSMKKKIIL